MPYIGNTPALDYISFAVQNFTVTAATTVYTLDYSVSNENDIALYINSVAQRPGVSFAYSATGTTLTLTSATLATDTMYAVFIGRAVQTVTPAAGSVTNTMLSPSVITGQTAETSVAGGDLVLIYDDSATALRKMTRTNFTSGLGITEADAWRINTLTTFSGAGSSDVTANWERADSDGFGLLGTGLTQSSGIFTFPSTGYWYINHFGAFSTTAATLYMGFHLFVTLNNSSYTSATEIYDNTHAASSYACTAGSFIIKVTDAANIKFKFQVERSATVSLIASTSTSQSGFSCIKLGEI
jgi:hypothetical protein